MSAIAPSVDVMACQTSPFRSDCFYGVKFGVALPEVIACFCWLTPLCLGRNGPLHLWPSQVVSIGNRRQSEERCFFHSDCHVFWYMRIRLQAANMQSHQHDACIQTLVVRLARLIGPSIHCARFVLLIPIILRFTWGGLVVSSRQARVS